MALSKCLFTLVLLATVTALSELAHGLDGSPEITSTTLSEVVVNPEDNYTITCEGDSGIIWKYPNIADSEPSIQRTQKNGKFISTIQLTNITYKDVGYYYCLSDIENERNASIYLYVNDTQNLLTHSDIPFAPLHGIQYQDIIIPCKPTHPEVKVTLCRNSYEELHIGENDDIGVIRYNPKLGFILENAQIKNNGFYFCCALPDGTCSEEGCPRSYTLGVLKHSDSVAKPAIDDSYLQHVKVGENVTIECKVTVPSTTKYSLDWVIPNKSDRITVEKNVQIDLPVNPGHHLTTGRRKLYIYNAKVEDTGNYTCNVKDHVQNTNSVTVYLKIFKRNEAYINLTINGNKTNIEVEEGQDFKWAINVDAHPQPTFLWFKDGAEISNSSKTIVATKDNGKQSILLISHVTIADRGTYQMQARNEILEKELTLKLIVLGKPQVFMSQYPLKFLKASSRRVNDSSQQVNVTILGKPSPNLTCFFQPDGSEKMAFQIKNFTKYTVDKDGYNTVSELQLNTTVSGTVECIAANKYGNDSEKTQIIITDVADGFGILPLKEEIIEGDTVPLVCLASKHNFTDDLKWYRNGEEIKEYNNTKRIWIRKGKTDYSFKSELMIVNASESDGVEYKCVACILNTNNCTDSVSTFTVAAIKSPQFSKDTNMNGGEHLLDNLSRYSLNCRPSGVPKPRIEWMKDGKQLHVKPNDSSIEFMNNNTTLVIKQFTSEQAGEYTCTAINPKYKGDRKSVMATLKLKEKGGTENSIIVAAVLSVIFVPIAVVLAVKIHKERKIRKEQRIAGLMHFRDGAVDNMNPDLPVDEQAELLPYDKKWEFPREKLRLGKQLGSGAFGVVMKAEAFGILEEEPVTTVAVKMVKRNTDYTYIKALASELKIMVHLGKHLNVVNLLGACTTNITKKELLVIVEYCRYGNLHNYLLRHRDEFIDQIDPKTGVVDPTIGQEILERADSFNNKNRVKYAALSFSNSLSGGGDIAVDYRAAGAMVPTSSSSGSDADHVSMLPAGEDDYVLSNNSIQPEWRSNYRGDYKGNVRPICTCDLLCWAFQVAKGMEYLASRKVLHGDLAARNILLADGNVVKICDFGLAKSMYKSNNYKKKGDGPLPVKWMAIESIRDRIFSTQSDVWSYGIVLWEFFSLARTPYPGMEADEKLYNKLLNGYRMEKPEYSTDNIHHTMLDCWHLNPNKRPSFTELSERMGNMLEESVRKHYIDLNDPYIDMNSEWMQNTQSDYLSMMSAPTYGNLVSPTEDNDYINSPLPGSGAEVTDGATSSGYLCMGSPSTSEGGIFSPHSSRSEGNVFTFDGSPQAKSRVKEAEHSHGPELRPMLKSMSDSETEQPAIDSSVDIGSRNGYRTYANGNITTPSFSNPAYHNISNISHVSHINPSADNYVNMPQQKKLLKGKENTKAPLETYDQISLSGQGPNGSIQNDFLSCQDGVVKHEGYVNFPNNNAGTFAF